MNTEININTLVGDEAANYFIRSRAEWELALRAVPQDGVFRLLRDMQLDPKLNEIDRQALIKVGATMMGATPTVVRKALKDETAAEAANDDKALDDRTLARLTLESDKTLIFGPQGFYKYRDHGVWTPAAENEIRRSIGFTLEANKLPVNNRAVTNVFALVKDEGFNTDVVFDRVQADRINVLNGTLELKVGEWVLREHRREEYLTQQLPVTYDVDATCPLFIKFLDDIFKPQVAFLCEDKDKAKAAVDAAKDAKDKALLILEMLGYTLLQTCCYEKFIVLLGKGCNGKSVLLKVLQALLGKYGYSAVTPADLSSETSRLMLRGKLANIVPELPVGSMLSDNAMKSFTSGEAIDAKKLYEDKLTINPFATLWLGTNNLPHSKDLSRGMFRRALLVNFNQSFEGREDVNLIDKLLTELPGILTAACNAYAAVTLRENGFTIPASSVEAVKAWRMSCDQVAQFVEDRCHTGPAFGPISHSELFDAFKAWADEQNIKHSVSGKAFTDRLEALGFPAGKHTFKSEGQTRGKQDRGFMLIDLQS